MGGMAMVLEYWFYIYFHTLTPFLKEGVPTDVWPAIMIFKKDSLVKFQRGTSKHSLNTTRQQIELRTIVGTEWQSRSTSRYRDHPDIVHAREISKKRVAFYNPESDTSIMYLGERFLRQTRGFITIPRSPRERLEDLANPHDPINVVEGQDYKHVDQSMYVWWWKQQSIRFLLLEIYRQENRDEVGAASTQDPTFLVNQERKSILEYSKVNKGKPFRNEEVYRLFKAHVPGFNPEEFDCTQNEEDESEAPSVNASKSSTPARSDPRWLVDHRAKGLNKGKLRSYRPSTTEPTVF
ncbi:hypothetical protein C5167_032480 [Papaver somniferum]|uniref:Aminotransferase-like plant mobile domain-containing protein n=1 Tax=Papaver somniferum TaxID=3469 RepID=A0A4Y7K5H8_PAPSO|nr:hypothetical protein C5167_032480 [Papaver somniferum]